MFHVMAQAVGLCLTVMTHNTILDVVPIASGVVVKHMCTMHADICV